MQEYHMQTNLLSGGAPTPDRIPLHTREVTFRAYARADGLWDVEGTLRDTKETRIERPPMEPFQPGETVHAMHVRVTLDDALKVVDISSRMDTTPFGECQLAREPLQKLVGAKIGRGWRATLNEAMGGVGGCTHLRELLTQLATAAIQGISAYRDQLARARGDAAAEPAMPHYVGGCMTWRRDGPVVARLQPQYALPSPKETP